MLLLIDDVFRLIAKFLNLFVRKPKEMPVINLDKPFCDCTKCGGTGWQQRVKFITGKVIARRCPNCKETHNYG